MTTIDLLQRYSIHGESIHDDKTLHEMKALQSKTPDPDPSQYFDAKTKLLHEMLDSVVKTLANNQSEPASEYEGTLWRSPLLPRSRSPAYSEISDSFESPGRIEHCTHDLLSTPMSPSSTQFRGPDGWPLGVEVAINDFQRGRLSTAFLQEEELPNRLVFRKQQHQQPHLGGNNSRKGQETASCESLSSDQLVDRQGSTGLEPLSTQKQQIRALFQQCGEMRDHLDSASLEPLAFRQQSRTRPQQQSDCGHRQETVDSNVPESRQQSNEKTRLDVVCIPTLSARRYGDKGSSLGNDVNTDLYPALANGNVPIGLGLQNAHIEVSISPTYSEKVDASHTQTDGTCLLHTESRQTALSDTLPHNTETHGNVHQAEPPINALAAALDGRIETSKTLGVLESIGVESIDREIGCQNTLEDSRNDTLQLLGPLTSEDSEASTDSDAATWNTLGLLEDILEEREDPFSSTLALHRGQPQHFTQSSAESFDLQDSGGACEKRDSMVAHRGPLTESSALSSSPPHVPPRSNFTINLPSKLQVESIKPSSHCFVDAKHSESNLSAGTMVKLKNLTNKEGRLPAAALAELRKAAESQPHFQTGPDSPEDQSQAEVHPLFRFKSFSRPFSPPIKTANDSALKYVFQDNDKKQGHEDEEGDNVGHEIAMNTCSLFQPEAQGAESFVTHACMKEQTLPPLDKVMNDTVPKYLCKEHDTVDQAAEYVEIFTPQRSTLRSSNDTTLVPSPENATPSSSSRSSTLPATMNRLSVSAAASSDLIPTSLFQPSISPATMGYYASSADGSPASYNSWASTPHHHEHSCSTPSTGATFPTSAVPTPNTPFNNEASNAHGIKMTPSSSFSQYTGKLSGPCGTPTTPNSSFGEPAGNKDYRRSVSFSSMFARYHKARYPELPTAAMGDSKIPSKRSAEQGQARELTNDPFTSTCDSSAQFALILRAPSKEDLADTQATGVDNFDTPTKRASGRFSMHRRSLSTSGRPNTNEGIERALSSLIFNPHRSHLRKRSHSNSASINNTARPDGSGPGHRRSLSVPTDTVEQKWEVAPAPTPLDLRDEFSMRYRPEPPEADDHYTPQKDALQGMKQGLRKVFGRK